MLKTILKKTPFLRAMQNEDGVAAIEFAIIAPIMIALYMGLAEVSLMITADRRVSHAASIMGDLSTQVETLDEDDIEDVMNATLAALGVSKTEANRVNIDLISFQKEADGSVTEVGYAHYGTGWSTKFNGNNPNAILLNTTSGLLVARVKFLYKSPSSTFVKNLTLKETFMLKPRKSATIPFENGGSTTIVCTRITNAKKHPRANCN